MKHGYVVLAKAKVLKAAAEDRRLQKKVRHNDHEGPLLNGLGELMQHIGKLSFALWSSRFEQIKDHSQVRGIALGRYLLHDRFRDAGQADRVALLASQVAKRRNEPAGIIELRDAPRAEIHRAARIQDETAAEIGIGLEFLDVKAIGAAIGPPIKPPQVIAGDVFAIFGEFDARTSVRAGMAARNIPLHGPTGQ